MLVLLLFIDFVGGGDVLGVVVSCLMLLAGSYMLLCLMLFAFVLTFLLVAI